MHKPFISLTFDDGWKSGITTAHPLLERYRMPATFYIISERIDDGRFPEYMNLADLQKIAGSGHEIGSHTKSHKHLPELSQPEIWTEIFDGLTDLRAHGFQPGTFAYPYGEWNPYIVKQVREAGFFAARSIIDDTFNDERTNPLLLRGRGVHEEHSVQQVVDWIKEAVEAKTWLILIFHQIEPAAALREKEWIYGTTPEVLEQILAHIHKENIQVLTLEKGMEKLLQETLQK
jgi:peptidoglycan/xylan/chitin deacetylase (PgdA/CDA1 family)